MNFIGIKLLIVVPYDVSYFCVVSCDISIFMSNFIELIVLPLFLDESGKWLVYFIYFLKE